MRNGFVLNVALAIPSYVDAKVDLHAIQDRLIVVGFIG
jgi:hypothetical protein